MNCLCGYSAIGKQQMISKIIWAIILVSLATSALSIALCLVRICYYMWRGE
jgi:hypothetical protein